MTDRRSSAYGFLVRTGQTAVPTLEALRRARTQQDAAWQWLRLVGPVIVALTVLTAIESRPRPGLHGTGLGITIAITAFAVGAFGALIAHSASTGRILLRPAFIAVLFAGSVVLVRLQPGGPGVLGLFVAVALVARRMPARAGTAVAGSVLVFLVVMTAGAGNGRPAIAGLLSAIAMASFYAVTLMAHRLRETNEQAIALLVELEETREAQARAAALAERQRLACDMHDVLAHSLSGLMLQLEGARMLASRGRDDEVLAATIDRAHHLAKSGLDEARRAIGMLRDEALPGPGELPTLTAQFEHDTGIACELTVVGEERALSAEARLALYRVTQESLTNVAKYARPERVIVHLAYEPDRARLTVEDYASDGRECLGAAESDAESDAGPDAKPDAEPDAEPVGYGLTGMGERAELVGGSLTAAPTQTGFRVELEMPA